MPPNFVVTENSKHEEFKNALEQKRYVRAAHLATSLPLADSELKCIQCQALCQMAETYRNANGTRILAQKYGYSKQEAKQILEQHAEKISEDGKGRSLKVCYDSASGKYLTFEEWIFHCIEKWHKLKVL